MVSQPKPNRTCGEIPLPLISPSSGRGRGAAAVKGGGHEEVSRSRGTGRRRVARHLIENPPLFELLALALGPGPRPQVLQQAGWPAPDGHQKLRLRLGGVPAGGGAALQRPVAHCERDLSIAGFPSLRVALGQRAVQFQPPARCQADGSDTRPPLVLPGLGPAGSAQYITAFLPDIPRRDRANMVAQGGNAMNVAAMGAVILYRFGAGKPLPPTPRLPPL